MVIEHLVRSSLIIKIDVIAQAISRLLDGIEAVQKNILIFDAAPQPFDVHIISPTSFAIHAYENVIDGQTIYPCRARKLAALITVNNPRLAPL